VRYCPICDGYEAIDKRIGVVGGFEAAARKALFLRTFSKQIYIFQRMHRRDRQTSWPSYVQPRSPSFPDRCNICARKVNLSQW
jgi:thioredoxin reductase